MSIPNMLSIFRLILIPVFTIVFFSPIEHAMLYSSIVFVISGVTDLLDGYIARKYNQVTKLGIVLDPLADKLTLLVVLFCLFKKELIPSWILIFFVAKELSMILGGIFAYTRSDLVIPSNIFGKLATIFFYFSIFVLLFDKTIGIYLVYATVISAVIALFSYIKIFWNNKHSFKK
ncbi:CDP-diacylglycerol--glycerol-3-phosphate 3-phosphatidyltransferase [Clostridium collagenovorans DSM 3089]|uniref:CDP-diacylglycerol--glycerol-3-phosphate 3-phosphatidyltransferase n=1 Tax=Clostridium collagenovorans DSM 3089 TaxID=1121306 RepID=A0A1M5YGJ2_9CLOT|nr:CDP-diacylglycerol--glycerol-3-phosphate 3-phosphatidyltransferase [Clostridium collagenovorans]SHI10623.1 CDP-diacylglycerol--glycerol-3-phosphate 3-phosphatidyltransferase [Clostridium collagenovorans DSM 3089]